MCHVPMSIDPVCALPVEPIKPPVPIISPDEPIREPLTVLRAIGMILGGLGLLCIMGAVRVCAWRPVEAPPPAPGTMLFPITF